MFGTFFIFPYIGNNHLRGVQTTNQLTSIRDISSPYCGTLGLRGYPWTATETSLHQGADMGLMADLTTPARIFFVEMQMQRESPGHTGRMGKERKHLPLLALS